MVIFMVASVHKVKVGEEEEANEEEEDEEEVEEEDWLGRRG